MSETILKRDINGNCAGECRDRVNEGRHERQVKLSNQNVETPEYYPNVPGAGKRNNAPGDMGGHV